MPKKYTGAQISIQRADSRPVRRTRRIQQRIDFILSSIWLVTGCIGFTYFLLQTIRGVALNLGMYVMGGLGLTMLFLYVISKVFSEVSERLFATVIFKVFRVLYIAAIASSIVIAAIILMSQGNGRFQKTDYVIVLGAKVNENNLSLSLTYRLDKAMEYISKYPDTVVILSGGKGKDEPEAEASAMEKYLRANSAISELTQIIQEDRSESTYENLLYSAEIIRGIENAKAFRSDGAEGAREFQDEETDNSRTISNEKAIRVTIITSDYHMLRTRMIAKRVGFDAVPIAAETPIITYPSLFLREIIAVVKSYFVDR